MIFIASFSHPWRNLQQMMVRSKSESKFMGSLYQIDLNKSSVSQYCILPRLILVARSSIAFYFVNISLVPVHSALSIQPGQAQCGLWFQFVTLLWGLQPPWSWPVTMKWGSEANSIKLVRVSWDAGSPVIESVSHRSLAAASSVVSVFSRHCQHYHLSLFNPDPILPQLFSFPCPLPSGALFRPNTHPFPFLLPLWTIWALFCLSSIRIKLESVLSKLVLQYHNLKFQYNIPLLDHFNPIIAPQTDYGG